MSAILGNDNPELLPLIELDLSKLPKGTPRIAGQDVKFDHETEAYKVTKSAPAEDIDEETTKKIKGHGAGRLSRPETSRLWPH